MSCQNASFRFNWKWDGLLYINIGPFLFMSSRVLWFSINLSYMLKLALILCHKRKTTITHSMVLITFPSSGSPLYKKAKPHLIRIILTILLFNSTRHHIHVFIDSESWPPKISVYSSNCYEDLVVSLRTVNSDQPQLEAAVCD